MKKASERHLKYLLLAAVAAVFSAVAWLALYAHTEFRPARIPMQFDLKAGSSLKKAAQQMATAGVLRNATPFVILARLLGAAGKVKAGNYEVNGPISPLALLRKVTEGDYTQSTITFVEGWTFRQVRRALDEHRISLGRAAEILGLDLRKMRELNQSWA